MVLTYADQIILLDRETQSIVADGSPLEIIEHLQDTFSSVTPVLLPRMNNFFSDESSNRENSNKKNSKILLSKLKQNSYCRNIYDALTSANSPFSPVRNGNKFDSQLEQISNIEGKSSISFSGKTFNLQDTPQLVDEESKQTGSVGWLAYWYYLYEGGICISILILIASIWITTAGLLLNYASSDWMQSMEESSSWKRSEKELYRYLEGIFFLILAYCFSAALQIYFTRSAAQVRLSPER